MIKKILHFLLPGNRYQQFLFLVFLFLSLPLNLLEYPAQGLGPSWRISINLALKENLRWGDEYVFTFGPLGYLYTRISAFVPQWHIVLFSLFVWINILFIARYFILLSGLSKKAELFRGLIIAVMFFYVVRIEATTTVMYVVIFHLLYSIKHSSSINLLIAVFAGVINMFIKLNYFIPLAVIFGMYYFIVLVFSSLSSVGKKIIPVILLQAVLVYLMTVIYNVDIVKYIQSGWHLANAYNDAMFQPLFRENILAGYIRLIPGVTDFTISVFIIILVVILTAPLVFILWSNRKKITTDPLTFLTTFFCLFFLFISFKFAFVRHGGLTYLYPPLPLFILGLFVCFSSWKIINIRRNVSVMLIAAFLPACVGINVMLIRSGNFNYSFAWNKLKEIYRKTLDANPNGIQLQPGKDNAYFLPKAVREKIGGETVDIVSSEISIAYFNDLNYSPRPVVQGYAAYDKYLDDLNCQKYISSSAPQYLIYHQETIDDRYHFFDEPATKTAILRRYTVIDSFDNKLLFKRSANVKKIDTVHQGGQHVQLNQFYAIPETGEPLYATFDIKYSNGGSIARFMFQPPQVTIHFVLEDGRQLSHRLVITTLHNPVLISHYIENVADAKKFFTGSLPDGKKIKKMMISSSPFAYMSIIKVEFKKLIPEGVK